MNRTPPARCTVRHKGTRTSFASRNKHNTTSVEINGPLSGGKRYSVLIESWHNDTPERCYYTHRTITADRAGALRWARDMLPLPIAL